MNCKTCTHIGTYISGMDKMLCHKHDVWTSIYNDDTLCLDTIDATLRQRNIDEGRVSGQLSLFEMDMQ